MSCSSTRDTTTALQRLVRLYEKAVATRNYLLAESLHRAIQARVVTARPPGAHSHTRGGVH